MKKYLSFALVAMLLVSLLAGCGLSEEDVAGSWEMVKPDTQEKAMALLEKIDAYEEEVALADLDSLEYVKIVEFHTDGTYCVRYDVDGTMACIREFYDAYFNTLYEGRTTLEEAYDEDLGAMTPAEFRQYYAALYGYIDYIEMLDNFVLIANDYEAMEEPYETGTFRVKGSDILITATGESEEETIGAQLEEGVLTLTSMDGVEVYTRK